MTNSHTEHTAELEDLLVNNRFGQELERAMWHRDCYARRVHAGQVEAVNPGSYGVHGTDSKTDSNSKRTGSDFFLLSNWDS
jgi:hypothetical protein